MGIFIILLCGVLYLARAILVPVVSAFVVGAMLGPLQRRAAAIRMPTWLFATAMVVLMLGLIQLGTMLLSTTVIEWIGRAPELAEAARSKLQFLERGLALFRALQAMLGGGTGEAGLKIDIATVLQPMVTFLTPALGELLIFFATLFFYLLGRDDLRREIILFCRAHESRLRVIRILNEVEQDLGHYVGTVTMINLGLGVITALGAWAVGLPNPALFGVIAFLCNYLPYIGPAIVVLLLFGIGLVSFPTFQHALLGPALFIGLATLEGHFVTPNIIGMRFTLNALAVFVALTFWTWMWGPAGAFLSVPFLIIAMVVRRHFTVASGPALPAA